MPDTDDLVTLVYAGPVEEVEIRDAVNDHEAYVTRGVPFEVPPAVAGRAAPLTLVERDGETYVGNTDELFEPVYDGDRGQPFGLLSNPDFIEPGKADSTVDPDFDPGAHTVDEVNAYLEALPGDPFGDVERERVHAAELAGRDRASLRVLISG